MFRKRIFRRTIGVLLVMAGALLMWLAPESPAGVVLLATGIALEIVGLRLEHTAGQARKPPNAVEQ